MELAVNILAGVLGGACFLVTWAAVQQTRLENSRFRRGLLKAADGLDKLLQQIQDKQREIDQLVQGRFPELTKKTAEAETVKANHKREIAESKESMERSAAAWDTRTDALEEAGVLHGSYIVAPERVNMEHVEFLQENGYKIPKAGEFPKSESDLNRPPNPVRENQNRVSVEEKRQNRTEKRLTRKTERDLKETVVPEPTRLGLDRASRRERLRSARQNLGETVRNAVQLRRGGQKEIGSAESRHAPSPENRSTRKGT